MPLVCAAYNCNSRRKRTDDISYFRFPLKKKELLKQWIINMKRDKWCPSEHSFLCSRHFEDKYIVHNSNRRRILSTAVPTIFDFPTHLQEKQHIRPSPKERQNMVPVDVRTTTLVPESVPTNMELNSSEMVQPVMLVHGGAGDIPDNRVQQKIDGVCRAAKKGYAVLTSGGSVIDAVQAAVQVMEDDEAFNAGYGSVLNEDGEVEMDAIVMEGRDLKTGAVGAIKNVAHPVDVARLVMEKTPHVLLVGEGAKKFANDQGIPDVPVGYLVTKFAKQSLAQIKSGNGTPTSELGGVGTVGAVAVDTDGHLAVATSTGGTSGKMVGRVGDTPLPGCGGFADDDVGAVSTTGHGESIMRFCLAHTILELMKQGKFANEATKDACEAMTERVGDTAGAITLSNKGEVGISFTSRRMAWAYVTGENICYGIEQNDETCENVKSCKRGK